MNVLIISDLKPKACMSHMWHTEKRCLKLALKRYGRAVSQLMEICR